jgi:peroxiredoxin/outer membrane lipoprotein-sorting protein
MVTVPGLLLLLLAAPSQTEVTKIVASVEAKFRAATEYAFEGEMLIEGQRGPAPGRVLSQGKISFALAPHSRYYLRLAPAGKDEYLLVSNGEKSWAYVPRLKQYTEEEGAQLEDSQDDEGAWDSERDVAETLARLIVPNLARLLRTAAGVDMQTFGNVKYEGKKAKWPVLRVLAKPEADGTKSMTELTIDPDTLRIGRLVWSTARVTGDERTVIRLTVDFTRFRAGEPLPDSTFTFEPPKNAKLVDSVPIPGQTGSFLLNRPAPDIELKTLDGERVRLADFRGHPVLVTFWASWCGPCRRELPEVAKLYREFREKGLIVLGVNDEGRGAARSFVEKVDLPFPVLDDSGLKAHRLFRVRSIPTVFLIDADGKVVRFFRGAKGEDTLRAALQAVGL